MLLIKEIVFTNTEINGINNNNRKKVKRTIKDEESFLWMADSSANKRLFSNECQEISMLIYAYRKFDRSSIKETKI